MEEIEELNKKVSISKMAYGFYLCLFRNLKIAVPLTEKPSSAGELGAAQEGKHIPSGKHGIVQKGIDLDITIS